MSIAVSREEPPPRTTHDHRPEPGDLGTEATIFDLDQAGKGGPAATRRPVLIAEDHEGTRSTLAEIMRDHGYLVIEAQDGQEALGVLRGRPVDVLILDLAMPRVDGIELLRQINPPPPVVVIYSAFEYYTPEELRSRVGSKVFRFLRKPVAPLHVVSAVVDAIEELDHLHE